jgi:hypothetical protein
LIIVRLLLFLALASIGAAVLLWLVKRDPRYLRFIGLTLKFTVLLLLGILLWFAAQRLLAPGIADPGSTARVHDATSGATRP